MIRLRQSARPRTFDGRNSRFFNTLFAVDPWAGLYVRDFPADANSLFGDGEVVRAVLEARRPEFIVEVGSWKGHSANFMADQTRRLGLNSRIVCVDTFLGSSEHWMIPDLLAELRLKRGRPTVYEAFIGNTLRRRNQDRIYPFPIDALGASSVLGELGFEADLIFIDGAHDYESVLRDLTRFHPLLGADGVLFGDDYQEVQVGRAVHDFAEQNGLIVRVALRKWVCLSPGQALLPLPDSFVERTTRDGWVHP